MNWYTQQVFPKLMEGSLASSEMMALRRELLADVEGSTLEIGIGGGLNLACYPAHIRKITAVDVHPPAASDSRRAGRENWNAGRVCPLDPADPLYW